MCLIQTLSRASPTSSPFFLHRQMSLRDSVKSRRQSVPSTPSKRSPSPRLTFTHITRTVIKRLEGFGHVDTALMLEEDEEEEGQVEQSLRPQLKQPSNGSATAPNRKIDWEIPRKLLHSSIGWSRTSIIHSSRSDTPQASLPCISTYLKAQPGLLFMFCGLPWLSLPLLTSYDCGILPLNGCMNAV